MNAILKEIPRGLSHLLFPKLCESCCTPLIKGEKVICMICNNGIPRTHFKDSKNNEMALRLMGRFPFQVTASLAYFTVGGMLQHLLHGLKYEGKKDIGIHLGKLLGYEILKSNWINEIDAVIPIPLFPKKEFKRGFNQCNIIAQGLVEICKIEIWDEVLFRTTPTESQTKKNREQRLNNMKEVFQVKKDSNLMGKKILLLDDVLTTGATIEAAAQALLKCQKDCEINIATIGIAANE